MTMLAQAALFIMASAKALSVVRPRSAMRARMFVRARSTAFAISKTGNSLP